MDLQVKRKHLRLLEIHAKEPPDFQLDMELMVPRPGGGGPPSERVSVFYE